MTTGPIRNDDELDDPETAPGTPPARQTAGTEYSVLEPNIRFWDRIRADFDEKQSNRRREHRESIAGRS